MPSVGAQPIPDWVCRCVEYKAQVRKVLAQLPLEALAVNERLERAKLVMREVGTQVRNRLSHDIDSCMALDMLLSTLART
eukprot:7170267-Karenia_brevis.AAC.1